MNRLPRFQRELHRYLLAMLGSTQAVQIWDEPYKDTHHQQPLGEARKKQRLADRENVHLRVSSLMINFSDAHSLSLFKC
jgi:hypothetical protein